MTVLSMNSFFILLSLVTSGESRDSSKRIERKPGWNMVLKNVGELTSDQQPKVANATDSAFSVGYIYNSWPGSGPSFWTADGRFVIYQTNQERSAEFIETQYTYWHLDDGQWRELLGESPVSRFSVPWQYRFPVATTLLVPVTAAGTGLLLRRWLRRRNERRRHSDVRFADAVEKIFAAEPRYASCPDPDILNRELMLCVCVDITEHEARASLLAQVNDECRRRCKALRQRLIEASDLAEANRIDECQAVLEEVGLALDPDRADDLPIMEQLAVLHEYTEYLPENWLLLWQLLSDRSANAGVA